MSDNNIIFMCKSRKGYAIDLIKLKAINKENNIMKQKS